MFNKTIQVKQVMTKEVLFVETNETMEKVKKIFKSHSIHHIPVLDKEGKVVGMVSKTDYHKILHGFTLFKSHRSEQYNDAILRSLLVKDVMTKQVAKLNPDDSVMVAVGIFKENLFHAMPVVNKEGHLLGILSTYDLINYAFGETATLS